MNSQVLEEKLIIFENDLTKLYEETLFLKIENEKLFREINHYKKEMISDIVNELCDKVVIAHMSMK
tara:strand:+ start:368 stop:565 length:198 start_codon:yes stop_codon:yes gene_type:complete